METRKTQCCIVGGGPAGLMLGFLLARSGVDVLVLEKHKDFLRDFRGDTIHPSTLELMHELNLLDQFLQLPHQKAKQLRGWIGDSEVTVADFTHLPTKCKFLVFMPQWDFLDFLADQGRMFPSFHLEMNAEVQDLIETDGRVTGVKANTSTGSLKVHADVVIGTDGRHSTVRKQAGLEVEDLGAPIDVLWMRFPRITTDPEYPIGRFEAGQIMALIYRGSYWQYAYVIPKGGFDELRAKGLTELQSNIAKLVPFLHDRVSGLQDWNDIKLLTVKVDRLRQWVREGLLCIGDAAHAMSPIGGVGINLAIQDAVAAANLLTECFQKGKITKADLLKVQKRREFPTRVTQRVQVLAQNRVIGQVLAGRGKISPPFFMKWPLFSRLTARAIGVGIRSEHLRASLGKGSTPPPIMSGPIK